jgi:hypothetical protein
MKYLLIGLFIFTLFLFWNGSVLANETEKPANTYDAVRMTWEAPGVRAQSSIIARTQLSCTTLIRVVIVRSPRFLLHIKVCGLKTGRLIAIYI